MKRRVLIVENIATVRRVAQRTLEQHGYEVAVSEDGREGLEQAQRSSPDLIFVDLYMPHLSGRDFCASLRAIANLRATPVILMSARSSDLSDATLAETGATDAIAKPFSPEALIAVTEHTLARDLPAAATLGAARPTGRQTTSSGGTPATTSAESASALPRENPAPGDAVGGEQATVSAEAATLDSVPTEDGGARQQFGDRQGQAAATAKQIASYLGAVVVRTLADGSSSEDAKQVMDGALLATGLMRELGVDGLMGLTTDLGELALGTTGELSLVGRLEHVPLGDALQMLQQQRQTGLLEIRSDDKTVTICLREGLLDVALGEHHGRELLLGRYLLDEELIDAEDLENLVSRRNTDGDLLGKQLVKLGYITADDLHDALVRQTSELVYEALRWRVGRYRFRRFAPLPAASDARLALPVAAVLMEGLRRVDEWRLIEEQIESFDRVLQVRRDAVAAIDAAALSADERQVLDAIDGNRTVREIVEHTNMSSFPACKILFQLVTSGLVHDPQNG